MEEATPVLTQQAYDHGNRVEGCAWAPFTKAHLAVTTATNVDQCQAPHMVPSLKETHLPLGDQLVTSDPFYPGRLSNSSRPELMIMQVFFSVQRISASITI